MRKSSRGTTPALPNGRCRGGRLFDMLSRVAAAVLTVACLAPAASQHNAAVSADERRIVALVSKAAALIERSGREAAFREFRKPNSEWFHDDTYLFAYDMDLNVLLNPAFPDREGRNLAAHRDATGRAVHEEIRAVVKANAAGWVDTIIAQPGRSTPAKKRVYVMAVTIDGKPGIIGSGFYH
jgi:cytochrome c